MLRLNEHNKLPMLQCVIQYSMFFLIIPCDRYVVIEFNKGEEPVDNWVNCDL